MEQRILRQGLTTTTMLCFALFLLCSIGGTIQRAEAYKNYTVGGSSGWFDKLNKPEVDFDTWASGKTFSLGDFLIFNTDNNHSVVQTHNFSTYSSCDSQGDDNVLWSTIDPNSTMVRPITVNVPLLKEGPTYFFSGDYDGEQCVNGQKFSINVTHGQGLPPSLKNNPDFASGPTSSNAAPGPADPDSGDDQAAPDTIVSSNFNHPKQLPEDSTDTDDEEESGTKKTNAAGFVSSRETFLGGLIGGVLVLAWIS